MLFSLIPHVARKLEGKKDVTMDTENSSDDPKAHSLSVRLTLIFIFSPSKNELVGL